MSKAASMGALEKLHATVAKVLNDELEAGEVSPQMLAQAIKFLKDNGIEPARDVENKALTALADKIGSLSPEEAAGEYLN
jgi:hypothetical protein